jgi:nucleotide sugar dehydrogenase
MIKQYKIGIVGQGFVGTAIREGFKNYYHNLFFYDKDMSKSNTESLKDLCHKTDMIFVCLPTPMTGEGECYTGIVEGVIYEIDQIAESLDRKTIIIKSTIPPGTTELINSKVNNVDVIFNPEFLTEANAVEDFKNQDRIILGGHSKDFDKVQNLFSQVFTDVPIIATNSTTAEIVKYTTNTFLSTKVSFANEIKLICDSVGINYDEMIKIATIDKRLGSSHWAVPGPDGKKGFGGSCFPKDLQALIYFSSSLGLSPIVLKSVWEKNLEVRPEKDWEKLLGRAVVNDNE